MARKKGKKKPAPKRPPAFGNQPFVELGSLVKPAKAEAGKPPPAPEASPVRRTTTEEQAFLEAVAGATPLERRGRVAPREPDLESLMEFDETVMADEEEESLAQLAEFVAGEGPFDVRNTDEYVEGKVRGLDERILAHLRRGLFPVQGHLDLHGLSRVEAKEAVESYIARSRAHRIRCVLLVTGRGLSSPEGRPILKAMVADLLTTRRMSRQILAFATARPVDGGAGAIYVLLRK